MTSCVKPAVWVGCMACHNNGLLVGGWVDAIDAATLSSAAVHAPSAAPAAHDELWCYDHEGLPVQGELDPTSATAWAERLDEVPEHLRAALCAWVLTGSYIAEGDGDLPVIAAFEERFCGTWGSFRDYAENLAEELGVVPEGAPEELVRYFNWDAWTRDLEHDYTLVRADHLSVYIFRDL